MSAMEALVRKIATAIFSGSLDKIREAINRFLEVVLERLGKQILKGFTDALNFLLEDLTKKFGAKVQEWVTKILQKVRNAFSKNDQETVRDTCLSDEHLIEALNNFSAKAKIREGAKCLGKAGARSVVGSAAKEGVKQVTTTAPAAAPMAMFPVAPTVFPAVG